MTRNLSLAVRRWRLEILVLQDRWHPAVAQEVQKSVVRHRSTICPLLGDAFDAALLMAGRAANGFLRMSGAESCARQKGDADM
jgi:hypothetical protein